MPFDSPLTLGPFKVEPDGRLSPNSDSVSPSFTFQWRARTMRAMLGADRTMVLRTVLGRVPSTASGRTADRPQSFGLMRALATGVPEGWRVTLLPDHRAVLDATMTLPDPVTAANLLTGITDFLLRLAPYLDLADESGMPGDA